MAFIPVVAQPAGPAFRPAPRTSARRLKAEVEKFERAVPRHQPGGSPRRRGHRHRRGVGHRAAPPEGRRDDRGADRRAMGVLGIMLEFDDRARSQAPPRRPGPSRWWAP